MTFKLAPHRYFWILSTVFLVSCGTLAPVARGITPTVSPIRAQSVPSETLIPSPTSFPTITPLPPFAIPTSVDPTELPRPTPLPASLPKFPLDGYIMLFQKKGDLYYQNGNNSPIKLTHVG